MAVRDAEVNHGAGDLWPRGRTGPDLGQVRQRMQGRENRPITQGERKPPPARPAISKSWPLVFVAASAGLGSKPVVGNLWDLRPADALGWIQAYAAWRAVELCHPPRLPLWPTTERPP